MRLIFPQGRSPFRICDTHIPPSEAFCTADPADINSSQFIHVVELDDIKGITSFFMHGGLFGIHVHHSDESCAMDTWTREFGDRERLPMVWIYLPISIRDRAALLGSRCELQTEDRCILVRTKLAGDIIIGRELRGTVQDGCLGAPAPLTMFYGEPKPRQRISCFGAHSRAVWSDPAPPQAFELHGPGSLVTPVKPTSHGRP